jgi:hypothetical protein
MARVKKAPTRTAKAMKPRKFSSPLAKELIEGLEEMLEKMKTGGIASVKHTVLVIPPDVLHPIHIKQIANRSD